VTRTESSWAAFVGEPERPAELLERVRRLAGRRPVRRDVGHRATAEVPQVLTERVQVEVGVPAGAVVLVVPVVDEDPAVDVTERGATAGASLDDVLQLVEPAVLALDPGDEAMRRVQPVTVPPKAAAPPTRKESLSRQQMASRRSVTDGSSGETARPHPGGHTGGMGRMRRWLAWWYPPSEVRSVGEEPDYRFSLANERTFLAWIRTSLALLAGGVAVVQIVPSFAIPGGRHILGVPLVLMSIAVAALSYRHWAGSERALRLRRPLPLSALPWLLGTGVALTSFTALLFIIIGSRNSPK
jgi:putative membrane protein